MARGVATVDKIIGLLETHMLFHPFTRLSPNRHPLDSVEFVWKQQVVELTDVCKALAEPYVWEYLICNWYCPNHDLINSRYVPERWVLWARAVHVSQMPITETNAIVESHFSVLKKTYITGSNVPTIEWACKIIVEKYMVHHQHTVRRHRLEYNASTWYRNFKTEWMKCQRTNATDFAERYPDLQPDRVRELDSKRFETDQAEWFCTCWPYKKAPSTHLCKHLVRTLPQDFIPTYGQVHKQRQRPVIFIDGVHPQAVRERDLSMRAREEARRRQENLRMWRSENLAKIAELDKRDSSGHLAARGLTNLQIPGDWVTEEVVFPPDSHV